MILFYFQISFLYSWIDILDLNQLFNRSAEMWAPFKMKLIWGLQSWPLITTTLENIFFCVPSLSSLHLKIDFSKFGFFFLIAYNCFRELTINPRDPAIWKLVGLGDANFRANRSDNNLLLRFWKLPRFLPLAPYYQECKSPLLWYIWNRKMSGWECFPTVFTQGPNLHLYITNLVFFCETWNNNVNCGMHAHTRISGCPAILGRVLHSDRSFCLVCTEVNGRNCNTLHSMRLLWVRCKNLTGSNILQKKKMNLPYLWRGVALVAKELELTLIWACF